MVITKKKIKELYIIYRYIYDIKLTITIKLKLNLQFILKTQAITKTQKQKREKPLVFSGNFCANKTEEEIISYSFPH